MKNGIAGLVLGLVIVGGVVGLWSWSHPVAVGFGMLWIGLGLADLIPLLQGWSIWRAKVLAAGLVAIMAAVDFLVLVAWCCGQQEAVLFALLCLVLFLFQQWVGAVRGAVLIADLSKDPLYQEDNGNA